MKYILFAIFCIIIITQSCSPRNARANAQLNEQIHISEDSTPKIQHVFPDDWLGFWSGDLNIYNTKGLKQTVPMSLDLAKTDSVGIYTWAIIYGTDSTIQRRDYQLIAIDQDNGHYLIDEKNGILLDAYLIHNELTSIFEVMGNRLMTTYSVENNELVFVVKVFPSEEIRISGDSIIAGQEIPIVTCFQLSVSQIARLQKKCLVE